MTKGISLESALRCVGPGWSEILKDLYAKLPKSTYVTTVKEKFGGLRFYVGGVSERTGKLIDQAEEQSTHTCEMCGKVGEIIDVHGWLSCLCPACRAKREEGKK